MSEPVHADLTPVHLVFDGEMMLDAPVKVTWRHIVNYPSWQNYSLVQHISGEPGQEGEVVLLKKEEGGIELPSYYARTVKLDPQRRIIWKTYPQERSAEGVSFGIVEFRVDEAQGKTRFCYHTLYEFLVSHRDESALEAFRQQQAANIEAVFSSVFPKLIRLVEKDVR